jgi:hypothetical protein
VSGEKDVVLFTEAEHVVLSRWFEKQERGADRTPREDPELEQALGVLGFAEGPEEEWEEEGYGRLDAAVAFILLEADEAKLPNWRCRVPDGTVVWGRSQRGADRKPKRKVALHTQHLFTIDWASRPGFSWPEQYRLAWVPGYERHVLTISHDSSDALGYTDVALAAFRPGERDLVARVGETLREYWSGMLSREAEAWESFRSPGLVDEATAATWRAQAWREEGDDDDEDEEYSA